VLGTAVLGSMLTAIYRGSLVIPAGVPAETGEAARETLGGAVSAAGTLEAPLGRQLLDAATHAFDAGLVATAGVGAGVMVVAVVVALVSLRRASAGD
jgi:DHA2 family multidrug resistance protein-like MFS transporter